MTTIQVINQQGDVHLLELYDNDPINLSLRYTDIENIGSAQGSFSQTFRIPATEVNREVFGEFYNPNLATANPTANVMFNAKQRMKAAIMVDTIPVITGYLQLKEAITGNNLKHEFVVVFFGEANEFIKAIGDKKLADLDWSALNHNLNSTIVVNSWAGGFPAADPGAIVYGMIDKGWLFAENGFGQPISGNNPLRAGQFTPFIRLTRIVHEIFAQTGYNLKSSHFTSPISDAQDMYMPAWNGGAAISSVEGTEYQQFATRLTANTQFTVLTGQGVSFFPVANAVGSGVTFDQTGNFASNSFTPTVSGFYRFNMGAKVVCPATWVIEAQLCIRRTSGTQTVVWLQSEATEVSDDVTAPTQLSATTSYVWMEAGQTYQQQLRVFHVSSIPALQPFVIIANNTLPVEETTGWDLLPNAIPTAGTTVDVGANLPDITILDFLKSLQAMFNLVIVASDDDPFTITFDTWSNYVSVGVSKDWTAYVDNSKDTVIRPTTDIQRKRYEWRYSEDGDILNQVYIVNAQRTFGRFRIEDTGNDFAVGEKEVVSDFAPYPVNALGQNNFTEQWLIHKGYDNDGKVLEGAKPRLAYYGGLKPYGGVLGAPLWDDSAGNWYYQSTVPHFGNYDVRTPTVTDRDLNFGGDVPLHPIQANPMSNLYNNYWRRYVDMLYGVNARVMEARFKIDAVEVSTFKYNDRIFVKDSFWRVLEISYTPNGDDTAKVKLIKDVMDTPPCSVIPAGSNIQGIINFVDGSGSPAAATQECCELFGYVWVNIGGTMQCAGAIYDTDPINDGRDPVINPNTGGGVNGGGINVEVGSAIAWGKDVEIPQGTTGVIGGNTVKVGINAGSIIGAADRMLVESANSALPPAEGRSIRGQIVGGINVHGFDSGYHRGAGGYWDTISLPTTRGQAQNGEFTLIYEGSFNTTDEVELYVNGNDGQRIFLPNQSALFMQFDAIIHYMEFSGGVYLPKDAYGVTYRRVMRVRNNGVLVDSINYENADESVGVAAGVFRMKVTPTTDAQAIIEMESNNNESDLCRIVMKASYVMAKI